VPDAVRQPAAILDFDPAENVDGALDIEILGLLVARRQWEVAAQ
jgi:hypothetical protein